MNQKEYWEDQANRSILPDGKTYYDHPYRKRMILKYLLDYDFDKKRILEVGCGIATTAQSIRFIYGDDLFFYEGIDLSEKFSEFSRKKFCLSVKQGDISSIPFDPLTFDCIFLFDVLEHIPFEKRGGSYSEIDRVLKKDGIIFINNPISKSHHDPEFDHLISLFDIQDLCTTVQGQVVKLECYGYQNYSYQFIVIERHRKENT